MTPEEQQLQQAQFAEQMRILQNKVLTGASADSMLLVLSIGALFPVVQSIMAFASHGAMTSQDGVDNSDQGDQTSLATTALAISTLLNPRQEPKSEPPPRAPERFNLNVT